MSDTTERNAARKRRVTAQMVADAAGVSRSAVSRAFTEGAYVDAEKRSRIRRVAQELGYQPNAMAAGLKGGASHLVAIFVGDMRSPYDMEFVRQLVQALNAVNKFPVLIDGSGSDARSAAESVLRYPLEALILRGGSLSEELVAQCALYGVPMISSGRPLHAPGVDNVCARNAEGSEAVTRLLLSRGRRRIGLLNGPEHFYSSSARRAGALRALSEAGLAPVAEARGDYTVEGGHGAARDLLQSHDLDALICANDAMAIGALGAAQWLGRHVPEDLAVTGFDDIAMAAWPTYRLTTVRNPIDAAVAAIMTFLDSRAEDANRPERLVEIDPVVVPRASH